MELIGQMVIHQFFGEGTVVRQEGEYVIVLFAGGEKRFQYPDAFQKFLKAKDEALEEEAQRKITERKKEQERIDAEQKSAAIEKGQEMEPLSCSIPERTSSARQFFFVFQNKTFLAEQRGKYLWAPKGNHSHWRMMECVRKGDIIFHSVNRTIVAISMAISDCYSAPQPPELKKEKLWQDNGWKVDCEYLLIKRPLLISNHTETILKLQPERYAPLNTLGNGNTGYLFLSNDALSQFLIDQLRLQNRYLMNHTFLEGLFE